MFGLNRGRRTSSISTDFGELHNNVIGCGLDELKEASAAVVSAAIATVSMLEEEHTRIRACFIAMNSASDPILILDTNGQIYFSNDRFLELKGIDNFKSAIGLTIDQAVPELEEFNSRCWSTLQTNVACVIDCDTLQMSVTIVPMMNGAPKPKYYICTFKPYMCVVPVRAHHK